MITTVQDNYLMFVKCNFKVPGSVLSRDDMAKAELEVSKMFQLAADSLSPGGIEIYRLNVLERIGREEGSQIVVYGLGGDPATGREIALGAAGASVATKRQPPKPKSGEMTGEPR